jgi:glycerophosphoryl diester phosphodiesterase
MKKKMSYYWTTAIGAFCLYWATSFVLFYNPALIHKKKKDRVMSSIKHISHRGGCSEFPENTIPAFQNALTLGTEMLEMDLHLTKDEEIVVMHDDDLYRVTGVNGRIKNLNYDELPTKVRDNLACPFPEHLGQSVNTVGLDTHVPKLEELFQLFPGVPFNIDLKQDSDLLLEKTHALIKKYNREDLVIWGSFRDNTCTKCYEKDPSIPLIFSAKAVAKLLALHYTGLLPFVPIRESYLEIPAFTERSAKVLFSQIPTRRVKMALWAIDHLLMNKRLFEHLNKRGIRVFTWVQNHEEDFEYCFKKGANGVMTDSPTVLTNYLKKSKKA